MQERMSIDGLKILFYKKTLFLEKLRKLKVILVQRF